MGPLMNKSQISQGVQYSVPLRAKLTKKDTSEVKKWSSRFLQSKPEYAGSKRRSPLEPEQDSEGTVLRLT